MAGYLDITFGPMFSGKTTALVDRANRFASVRKQQGRQTNILIINHTGDTRKNQTEDGLTPHSFKVIKHGNKTTVKTDSLFSIPYHTIISSDYIAIDECQFFEDLDTAVLDWVKLDKHIHCSGLVADSERKTFGKLIYLIPRADNVEQLKAFCTKCGDITLNENAPFTKSRIEKEDQTFIGAEESYIPVCGRHY